MSDNLAPEVRRRTMRAVKGQGTKIERRLFAMIAGMGLKGWKKNYAGVAGKPDVAFVDRRLAIFVDGCFWHGCPHCNRTMPKTNRRYWKRKIARNVALAKSNNRRLRTRGWRVIRIWEHQLGAAEQMKRVRARLRQALGGAAATPTL